LFPQVMRAVQDRYPRLQLALTELEPIEGLAALRAWQVDAALIDDLTVASDLAASNIETAPIFEDRLYAVLPLKHRLARKPHVGLGDLRDDLWAMDSSRNAYTQTVTAACERAGFIPTVNGRCGSFEVVVGLVQAGCSIAIMPGLRLGGFRGRLVAKPLHPEIKRNISVVFRRGERRNPALKAFLDEIEAQAERLRPPA
jgi:DNA-binding transcriptional LysR family regulator